MTTAKNRRDADMPQERTARYLTAALRLNPMFEAPQILNLRDRYLGKAVSRTASVVSKPDLSEQRAMIAKQLEKLRSEFWTTDLNELRQRLSDIQASAFPDLMHAIRRLQTVAAHRHLFPQLAEKGAAALRVFNAFREILVAPPFAAAEIRQKTMYKTQDVKPVRVLIGAIQKVMPEVYELEADWLDTMKKLKPITASSATSESAGFSIEFDGENLGWIVRLLIFGTIILLKFVAFSWR
ncbi:MAG: hypothetical protein KDA96_20025 [Planctomycetaceae bacterium]|nr:hypothetical protein [Planctomycetaceae bacterium]